MSDEQFKIIVALIMYLIPYGILVWIVKRDKIVGNKNARD